jgi:hypothetical protein
MPIDYSQYTHAWLKKKPLHWEREVHREATNIFAKMINKYGSEYTRSVAVKFAAKALKEPERKTKEEGIDGLLS